MTDHPVPNPNQPDALVEAERALNEGAVYMTEHRVTESWRTISRLHAALTRLTDALPEVERRAKADALREAAGFTAPGYRGPVLSRQWLRDRADQIEKGDDR